MNILIFTNHFYPEQFKVNDIAYHLAEKGDQVTVITGVPNYPKGVFFNGYGIFKRRKEMVKGVNIIRLPLIPRGNGGGLKLALNYLSYFITSLCYLPFLLTKKWDSVFVHETSPIFIGVAAVIVKRIKKIPLYFWVLDLWPESVTAASSFSNKHVLKGLTTLVTWLYKHSDKILVSSKGFISSIIQKGEFKDKIVYFPNWAEEVFEMPKPDIKLPNLPDGFKIMYAGNMGEAQDLEKVLEAAKSLKNHSDIKWILIGDGRKRPWMEEYIKVNQLENNVYLPGRYPVDFMPHFYKEADIMLLSLKNDEIFSLTVPARLQSYMACGKPVVAMINGEAASIIKDAACGLVADSGDAKGLADNILELYQGNRSELLKMGNNSRSYYLANFERSRLLERVYELVTLR